MPDSVAGLGKKSGHNVTHQQKRRGKFDKRRGNVLEKHPKRTNNYRRRTRGKGEGGVGPAIIREEPSGTLSVLLKGKKFLGTRESTTFTWGMITEKRARRSGGVMEEAGPGQGSCWKSPRKPEQFPWLYFQMNPMQKAHPGGGDPQDLSGHQRR